MATARFRAADVLAEHNQHAMDVGTKHIAGDSLVYVTPWNSHGYDVAKRFAAKFTYISPVWFQIRQTPEKTATITGGHDLDAGWIADVRAAGAAGSRTVSADGTQQAQQGTGPPFIVPRFVWEAQSLSGLEQMRVIDLVVETLVDGGCDGLVLEVSWQAPLNANLVHRLAQKMALLLRTNLLWPFQIPTVSSVLPWLRQLQQRLRAQTGPAGRPLQLILVLPPNVVGADGRLLQGLKSEEFLSQFVPVADRFSLMTYDYSSSRRQVGPNAPLAWVRECVEQLLSAAKSEEDRRQAASQIMTGVALYGHDNGQPIVGRTYIELLEQHKSHSRLHRQSQEHYFRYRPKRGADSHTVFYPTLFSLQKRLQLAEELGTGVSAWEIGQGLDYFYDLF